jgi:hypothetical protein
MPLSHLTKVARALGLDMTDLPLHLDTHRAELVEIIRDGDVTERLHYRVRMGRREVVLAISTIHGGWRVMNFLESDG